MRKTTRRFRWDRLLGCVLTLLLFFGTVWLIASYLDIVANNLNADPEYKNWNLFLLF